MNVRNAAIGWTTSMEESEVRVLGGSEKLPLLPPAPLGEKRLSVPHVRQPIRNNAAIKRACCCALTNDFGHLANAVATGFSFDSLVL